MRAVFFIPLIASIFVGCYAHEDDDAKKDDWSAEVTVHILQLIEQMNTRLSNWQTILDARKDKLANSEKERQENYRNLIKKIDDVESHLVDKIASLENRLEDKASNNIKRLREVMQEQIENRQQIIEEKVKARQEAVEERLKERKENLEAKMSERKENIEDRIKGRQGGRLGLRGNCNNREELRANITAEREAAFQRFQTVAGHLENSISALSAKFEEVRSNVVGRRQESRAEVAQRMNNWSVNTTERVYEKLRPSLESLQEDLKELNFQENRDKRKEFFRNKPKTCSKDMLSADLQELFPYFVMFPKREDAIKKPFLCDAHTDGGGWIVIQRRVNGEISFNRGYDEYKQGFGSLYSSFFLGLNRIHKLTSEGKWELLVGIHYGNESAAARYGQFSIGSEEANYALHAHEFDTQRGLAGDSLTYHNDLPFSTPDHDLDEDTGRKCATKAKSGWWFSTSPHVYCFESNLNGEWPTEESGDQGLFWTSYNGFQGVTWSEMKIRRVADDE